MDPLSELQDDLTLDDSSQALNQLKLASIDEKNWPSDDMPEFPKSGGYCRISGGNRKLGGEDSLLTDVGQDGGKLVGLGAPALLGEGQRAQVSGRTLCQPLRLPPDFAMSLR